MMFMKAHGLLVDEVREVRTKSECECAGRGSGRGGKQVPGCGQVTRDGVRAVQKPPEKLVFQRSK